MPKRSLGPISPTWEPTVLYKLDEANESKLLHLQTGHLKKTLFRSDLGTPTQFYTNLESAALKDVILVSDPSSF